MGNALKGLVLAGGKSMRTGKSKAKICCHGKQQQYYAADLLALCCEEVFIFAGKISKTALIPIISL